ncbi:hypothetical protein JNW90_13765 [Micromonospora sp. STR1s_5]|nr:hypothetical protein [Micromonospora sp. STR1s_5]
MEQALRNVVEECAKAGLGAGYDAFNATPSPEAGVRLGAAVAAFKGSFIACMKVRSVFQRVRSQYDLALDRRHKWVPGISVQAQAKDPVAEDLNRFIEKHAPKGTRKPLKLYVQATHGGAKVNVKVGVPDPKKLARDAKKLVPQLPREPPKPTLSVGGHKLF